MDMSYFKHVKNLIMVLVVAAIFVFIGCAQKEEKGVYEMISAKEAKALMDSETDYVILDVRTLEEYEAGHIKDAVLIPDYEIAKKAQEQLVNKEQLILVYCRSGNRSKKASEELAGMGYTNVKEFGGIIDWPYEVVTD